MASINPYGNNIGTSYVNEPFTKDENPGFWNRMLRNLSSFGMKYDDMIVRNQVSTGALETPSPPGSAKNPSNFYDIFAQRALTRILEEKSISSFDSSFVEKKRLLREYSSKHEIQEFVEIITDDCIIYNDDEDGRFCTLKDLPSQYGNNVNQKAQDIFNKIYNRFGFNDGKKAWNIFKQFLVEGYLAYEIVYDDRQRNIISFIPVQSETLYPSIEPITGKQIWIQFPEDPINRRILLDSQIIYLSYSNLNNAGEVSYVERLIRPYNILQIIKDTKIMFNITNATIHKRVFIPIDGYSKAQAEMEITKIMAAFKDDVTFNRDTGTLIADGGTNIPYSKEIWLPKKEGVSPDYEFVKPEGHNLNDDEMITTFYNELKRASRVPMGRLDQTTGGGNIYTDIGEVTRDEITFGKFINRLRTVWKEILIKPVYIQLVLEFPEFQNDENLKTVLNIIFNKENKFEEWKELNNLEKKANICGTIMSSFQDSEGNGFFAQEFAVIKWLKLSKEDLELNEKLKAKAKNAGGGAPGGEGGDGGGDDFGGGGDLGGSETGGEDLGGDGDLGGEGDLGDLGGPEIGSDAGGEGGDTGGDSGGEGDIEF